MTYAINGSRQKNICHCSTRQNGKIQMEMESIKRMTIGQLARRTGISIKSLREYERLGLIYTLGRSEGNYRLFDESALWCLQFIVTFRSLGLTLKEIQQIGVVYLEQPGEPIGPYLAEKLDHILVRVGARIAELEALRQRIQEFQSVHAPELAGQAELYLVASDPRRTIPASTP
jgi:MerR family transcriptional regulator, copper efflux regulator